MLTQPPEKGVAPSLRNSGKPVHEGLLRTGWGGAGETDVQKECIYYGKILVDLPGRQNELDLLDC